MGASELKELVLISNPTVENHKIDRLYKQSNQMHWFRRVNVVRLRVAMRSFRSWYRVRAVIVASVGRYWVMWASGFRCSGTGI